MAVILPLYISASYLELTIYVSQYISIENGGNIDEEGEEEEEEEEEEELTKDEETMLKWGQRARKSSRRYGVPGTKHPRPHWYRLGKKTGDVSDGNHEDRHVGQMQAPFEEGNKLAKELKGSFTEASAMINTASLAFERELAEMRSIRILTWRFRGASFQ